MQFDSLERFCCSPSFYCAKISKILEFLQIFADVAYGLETLAIRYFIQDKRDRGKIKEALEFMRDKRPSLNLEFIEVSRQDFFHFDFRHDSS